MSCKLSLIVACLLAAVLCGPYLPTKTFWSEQLKFNVTFEAYAGYESIKQCKGDSGMFYQLFSKHGSTVKEQDPRFPLILWLQGGPGSSSQFGAHTEVGPIKIDKNGVHENDFAWNVFGHLLFVDSPLNVGFSYCGERNGTKQVSSTEEAVDHLVSFLEGFYNTWPALKASPLYIAGESFAGHYVPVLADVLIYKQPISNITVGGVIIGDGWTDPINQINFYDSYLWSVGVIDRSFRQDCTWFQTNSMVNMHHADYAKATEYFDFLTNNDTTAEKYMGNISIFDFRNYNGMDLSFATFLQKNKKSLLVPDNIDYVMSNPKVYTAFADDITRSKAANLVRVLRKTKVLIYNGQNDVVVNTPGVLLYLNALDWEGIKQWKSTPKTIWTIFDEVRGWAKFSGNLWFVLVNGAGHMVPSDQPRATMNMINNFLYDIRDWKL